ncbi:kinase-like protein [Erysiphe pulchra]|uniref:cyclin-dependent kinase n=1 Tax=Erysiphe pulchra TaxID=225359 RepID=A0A2S4PSX2_9PEZI|nr:kinase-like protein [Erysiphe pulchra]
MISAYLTCLGEKCFEYSHIYKRKNAREEKKRLKAEKNRKTIEIAAQHQKQQDQEQHSEAIDLTKETPDNQSRPAKRRKLELEPNASSPPREVPSSKLLRFPAPQWGTCRSVENFEKLNDIAEGAYGWVSRAKEISTGKIVVLKKLKMETTNDGIPVTGLREIQTLRSCDHPNILELKEVVVGDDTSRIENIFIVLDFYEHDLKTLLEDMSEPFLQSEIKTLLHQITSGTLYLHNNWILHRDLKTSNLLLNNRGVLKIADFGMARYFGSPPPKMTQLVVTLWYRAPELLLGAKQYDTAIDMWSIGCIFGELLSKDPLLQGKNEADQLSKIFELCGTPTEQTWPGFKRLPNARHLRLLQNSISQGSVLRARFPFLTSIGSSLLIDLLSLNPAKRPSADDLLNHAFFHEDPKPKSTEMFPTFPSKAGQEKRRRKNTPNAPIRGKVSGNRLVDFGGIFGGREDEEKGAGFSLKLI